VHNGAVYNEFTVFKKAYDSIRRELLSNVLADIGVHMKRMRFGKKSLNKIYSKFGIKTCLMFIIHKKRRCFYSVAIDSVLENAIGKVHYKARETENYVTLFGKRYIPYRRTQTLKLSLTRMSGNK